MIPNRPIHLAVGWPLVYAIYHSPLSFIATLLEAGADPNGRQDGAATALHTAAMVGSEEMARLLVAAGADPDAAMDDGRTPRSIAPDVFRGL